MSADQRGVYHQLASAHWPRYSWRRASDINVYFWLHAATFLRSEGFLCLLTQAAWLDVDYGIPLQQWMLENFEVIAVLETEAEPWFTDARVATAVTILRRTDDADRRERNIVRFIQFRHRLLEIVGNRTNESERQAAFEALRDRILGINEDIEDPDLRARLVRQSDLQTRGTDPRGRYAGSKWGRYLRSTETLYRLQLEHAERFVNLSDLAPVVRGVTTNCDDFFLVTDVSPEALEELPSARAFRERFSANRREVEEGTIRIIRRDDAVEFALESQHLQPIMKTARDIRSFATRAVINRDFAVSINEERRHLSPLARRYVEAGEREEWHLKPSFEAIREAGGNWFTLRDAEVAPILFVKTMQYSPVVLLNDAGLIANQRLYRVQPSDGVDHLALCAVLNSTVFACERYAAVKALGREAAIDVEVFSANAFRCPDVRLLSGEDRERLRHAMTEMSQREVGDFREERLIDAGLFEARGYIASQPVLPEIWPAELRNPQRQLIDEIVLRLIGVNDAQLQNVRERIYTELVTHIRKLRLLELEAQVNRRGTSATGGPNPRQIADDIWARLVNSGSATVRRIPHDFITDMQTEMVHVPIAGELIMEAPSLFESNAVLRGRLGRYQLEFRDEAEAEYVGFLARYGIVGDVPMPRDRDECREVFQDASTYLADVLGRFSEAAAEITASRQLQQRIINEALRRLTVRR